MGKLCQAPIIAVRPPERAAEIELIDEKGEERDLERILVLLSSTLF